MRRSTSRSWWRRVSRWSKLSGAVTRSSESRGTASRPSMEVRSSSGPGSWLEEAGFDVPVGQLCAAFDPVRPSLSSASENVFSQVLLCKYIAVSSEIKTNLVSGLSSSFHDSIVCQSTFSKLDWSETLYRRTFDAAHGALCCLTEGLQRPV
jgi:hypothetical protein